MGAAASVQPPSSEDALDDGATSPDQLSPTLFGTHGAGAHACVSDLTERFERRFQREATDGEVSLLMNMDERHVDSLLATSPMKARRKVRQLFKRVHGRCCSQTELRDLMVLTPTSRRRALRMRRADGLGLEGKGDDAGDESTPETTPETTPLKHVSHRFQVRFGRKPSADELELIRCMDRKHAEKLLEDPALKRRRKREAAVRRQFALKHGREPTKAEVDKLVGLSSPKRRKALRRKWRKAARRASRQSSRDGLFDQI